MKENMFKPGDKVVMNDNYHVSDANKGRVWVVCSEPWMCCGVKVVLLIGKAGGYAVDGLDLVEKGSDKLNDAISRGELLAEIHRQNISKEMRKDDN